MKITNQQITQKSNKLMLLLTFAVLYFASSSCYSETGQLYGNVLLYKKPPSAYEIAKNLFPPKMRTITLNEQNVQSAPVKQPSSVAFMVNFEYDSVVIQEESLPYLDAIGDMLNFTKLKDKTLQIEGHADASGDEHYNLQLSEARAQSIKQYLQSVHRIDPDRLYTLGYGESKLLDTARPYAQVNRRAEFSARQYEVN